MNINILNKCYDSRKNQLEDLDKEIQQLEQEEKTYAFEEDMYYSLKKDRHHSEVFEKKMNECIQKSNDITKKIKNMLQEKNVISLEMEYIENIRNSIAL